MNQHPALTALHVIWLRQHNRLVNKLKNINPHWNGDRLYEEAKYVSSPESKQKDFCFPPTLNSFIRLCFKLENGERERERDKQMTIEFCSKTLLLNPPPVAP